MAKVDILDILRAKRVTPMEFDFDNLWIPPLYNYLTPQDIENLRAIATSARLSSKIREKYQMIDNIMRNRGFKRFAAGTNRVVYSCLEDDRFLAKIAVDKVGMQDNPMEYKNQFLLKPYVTKMFYHSPCGTVGFSERVLPIKNKAEFKEIADDVFDIIVNKILGKYVVEDIGTKYFMNWGIRRNHGPVLLDYPYIYKLDGKKLFCTKEDPMNHDGLCNGEIDYDTGFNHLVCTRCGKIYLATNLRDNSIDNKIIIKGGNEMKVVLKRGDKIIGTPIRSEEFMKRPEKKPYNTIECGLKVRLNRPSSVDNQTAEIPKVEMPVQEEEKTNPVVKNEIETSVTKSEETKPESVATSKEEILEEEKPLGLTEEELKGIMKELKYDWAKIAEYIESRKKAIKNEEIADSIIKKAVKESKGNLTESELRTVIGSLNYDWTKIAEYIESRKAPAKKTDKVKEDATVEEESKTEDNVSDDIDDKYGHLQDDEEEKTIRRPQQKVKVKQKPQRDSKGRFVASGGRSSSNRMKSGFIDSEY